MANSATNSSVPKEIINIYPENTASMGVGNIKHLLSCLPIYNTIASVLAVKFIIWIEWTLTSIFGLWHVLLLHMFGKYPSVGVLIGRGVPPLRSTEYPYCPRPQAPDSLPPQMITMGTQHLSMSQGAEAADSTFQRQETSWPLLASLQTDVEVESSEMLGRGQQRSAPPCPATALTCTCLTGLDVCLFSRSGSPDFWLSLQFTKYCPSKFLFCLSYPELVCIVFNSDSHSESGWKLWKMNEGILSFQLINL